MKRYLYGGYEEIIEEKNQEIERLNKELDYVSSELNKCQDKILDLENIIKEARKEIKKLSKLYDDNYTVSDKAKDILEILDRSEK